MRHRLVLALVLPLLAVPLAGCRSMRAPQDGPGDPDAAVADLRVAWLSAPAGAIHAAPPGGPCTEGRSRAFVGRQAENLLFRHPDHVPTLLLAGVTAYEAGDPV